MSSGQLTTTYCLIPGYPGYRVGDDGSVWSCLKRHYRRGRKGVVWVVSADWKPLDCKPNKQGYPRVRIGGRTCKVHTLVLLLFVGPRPHPKAHGCHKDRNPRNNRLSNLRWDTPKGNMKDRDEHGMTRRGERHYRTKLTEQDVRDIREAYAAGGTSLPKLAVKHNIGTSTVYRIVKRLVWKHVL